MAQHQPKTLELIQQVDGGIVKEGVLDVKTKRLIALGCVAVRMCEDCVYAQGLAAKKAGATKDEILEALSVAVLAGGVPSASVAKEGIARLFEEWDK